MEPLVAYWHKQLSEGVLGLLFPSNVGVMSPTQLFLSSTADKIPDMVLFLDSHPTGEPIFQYLLELLGVAVDKESAMQVLYHVFSKAVDKPSKDCPPLIQLFWDYAGIFDHSFPGCVQ